MTPQSTEQRFATARQLAFDLLFIACLLLAGVPVLPSMASTAAAVDLQVKETRSDDGVRISYLEGGSGDVTLVFIHGWICDRSYWNAQLPAFVDDYRVIAVDLAGHGDSALGRKRYSMEHFGADVAAASRGDGPVILVGHSMGGSVMLEAALLLGDRVRGLVGVDTLRNISAPITADDEVASLMAPLEEDYVATATQFLEPMFVASSDPALRQTIMTDMLATDRRAGIESVRGLFRMNAGAALKKLDAPLVLINSDYQPTNVPAVQEHHPDTTLYRMQNVGHFVMLEDPNTFNALLQRAVVNFLARPSPTLN